MKQIFRFFTFVGGIGAIAWLLRDRLVSVTTSREPEPPQFVPEPPRKTSKAADDLTEINGIGPTYADRLIAHGVTTFAELAGSDVSSLSEAISVPESRVTTWIQEAGEH